ncbi:GAF domain-containing protein [Jannaschia sp. R86511]|uniref:GAF domain-containing protein n=1 Tax=Jannaschia sp. R86511 TaxID=3093853 RepID=UPI0036D395FF
MARLARAVTGASVALVTLVNDTQVLVVAAAGRAAGLEPGGREPATSGTCGWVVASGRSLSVRDLRLDPRTLGSGAARELGLVSFLGVPLRVDDVVVGTVSVLDRHPRGWTHAETAALEDLAQLLGARVGLVEERQRADDLLRLHADVVSGSLSGVVVIDDRGVVLEVNPALTALLGWETADMIGRPVGDLLVPRPCAPPTSPAWPGCAGAGSTSWWAVGWRWSRWPRTGNGSPSSCR